jgi:hypothetical protein
MLFQFEMFASHTQSAGNLRCYIFIEPVSHTLSKCVISPLRWQKRLSCLRPSIVVRVVAGVLRSSIVWATQSFESILVCKHSFHTAVGLNSVVLCTIHQSTTAIGKAWSIDRLFQDLFQTVSLKLFSEHPMQLPVKNLIWLLTVGALDRAILLPEIMLDL